MHEQPDELWSSLQSEARRSCSNGLTADNRNLGSGDRPHSCKRHILFSCVSRSQFSFHQTNFLASASWKNSQRRSQRCWRSCNSAMDTLPISYTFARSWLVARADRRRSPGSTRSASSRTRLPGAPRLYGTLVGQCAGGKRRCFRTSPAA